MPALCITFPLLQARILYVMAHADDVVVADWVVPFSGVLYTFYTCLYTPLPSLDPTLRWLNYNGLIQSGNTAAT